ncbi:MAG: phosphatidylglycerol lysyltransferase domain-containing protein, partial [Gemmatimonadales bacterium]
MRARDLVLRHGWHATAYQILNPGITYWFSAADEGVVGYVTRRGVCVVAGAPVCAEGDLDRISREFEETCHARGLRVCYFGAEDRLRATLAARAAHTAVLLGAQPWWNPSTWSRMVRCQASVRAQLHRARNKGVRVREWSVAQLQSERGVRRCLEEWLETRGLPPLHFLVEPRTLGRLFDRRAFVACREGVVVGFLVASPIPTRNGWLIEQIIRGRGAPNGAAELMVNAAMEQLARSGASHVSLGLAPLSRHAGVPGADQSGWLSLSFRVARAAGGRFYNFQGLDRFKSKMHPDGWEGVYAITDEPQFSLRSLRAIAAAFTGASPIRAIAAGVARRLRHALPGM